MMHGHEKSDPAIVAVKPANKAERPAAERSAAEPDAAEPVEPRAGTEGNAGQRCGCRRSVACASPRRSHPASNLISVLARTTRYALSKTALPILDTPLID